MRLIDADALEAKLEEQRKLYIDMDMKGAEHLLVHDVLHHVWEAPTIDAVPVEVVADMFGEVPCNYAFCARQGDGFIQVDDFMYEQCDGWCEDKCGEVPTIECWKRFFKAWVERKDDE